MKVFNIIKIKTAERTLRQIRFFNIPIVNVLKKDNKIHFASCSPKRNLEKQSVFYLKYNNETLYSLFCLQHWINIIHEIDGDFYIICDKPDLELKILSNIFFHNTNIKFIKSDYSIPKKIINVVCTSFWKRAAYAHITTFYHAKKNNILYFWNIDADDTSFMHHPNIVAKSLIDVENYAKQKNISLFSLDMHMTRYCNIHWTFGVTFTIMNTDFEKLLKLEKDVSWQKKYLISRIRGRANVDAYFSYLMHQKSANISTFNIDNLYFIHWGGVSLVNLYRAIQVEKDNKMYFPIGLHFFNDKKYSELTVADNIININTGVKEEDSFEYFKQLIYGLVKNDTMQIKKEMSL